MTSAHGVLVLSRCGGTVEHCQPLSELLDPQHGLDDRGGPTIPFCDPNVFVACHS